MGSPQLSDPSFTPFRDIVNDQVKAGAVGIGPSEIIAALVNTSPIRGIALGVLGVSVVKRRADKKLP